MYISRIEISGFKSFDERILLDLSNGISCVVGPNGCGKSNVVDAIKWVLGEQSLKSLRDKSGEELVFNGTRRKKPKGMAEVALTKAQVGIQAIKEAETMAEPYPPNKQLCIQ